MSFHTQELNGIDSVAGQVFTGHVDEKSARFYRRANPDAAANVGAALTNAVTGSSAIIPKRMGILMTKDLPLNQ